MKHPLYHTKIQNIDELLKRMTRAAHNLYLQEQEGRTFELVRQN